MESVIQYLQPGLSTLAWNSMNIDAYLHQVHLANGRLQTVVDTVNKVVENGIQKNIAFIEKSTLFDVDLAFEKRWDVASFREELHQAVKEKQIKVSSLLKNVENSIQVWRRNTSFTKLPSHNHEQNPLEEILFVLNFYALRISISGILVNCESIHDAYLVVDRISTFFVHNWWLSRFLVVFKITTQEYRDHCEITINMTNLKRFSMDLGENCNDYIITECEVCTGKYLPDVFV